MFMYYFDSDTSEAPRGKQYIILSPKVPLHWYLLYAVRCNRLRTLDADHERGYEAKFVDTTRREVSVQQLIYSIFLSLRITSSIPYRTFHFESEEGDDLNDWVLSLMRDRYRILSAERNAYQQMMMETSDSSTLKRRELEKSIKKLEVEINHCIGLKEEAMGLLRSTLVVIGVSWYSLDCFHDMMTVELSR